MREFGEILGKYRILEGRPLGSIGLMHIITSSLLVHGSTLTCGLILEQPYW